MVGKFRPVRFTSCLPSAKPLHPVPATINGCNCDAYRLVLRTKQDTPCVASYTAEHRAASQSGSFRVE